MMQSVLIQCLRADTQRMQALQQAALLSLPDWCIAAGFVRNLAWDYCHHKTVATPLNDLDLIYFDPKDTSRERDRDYERQLQQMTGLPWSVKNQARMHLRNGDPPYHSCTDAMTYWVECETAVVARLSGDEVEIVAPFGVEALFQKTITLNAKRPKPDAFQQRIEQKNWLRNWPELVVRYEQSPT
ncbi:nucleotidyltransferase family protein [Gynuella sp.]|uniref:nucleotidyltransferase family protein n=1 Tax=Gynuella sp. TaxID=2969146 RepID=UPI003D0F4AE5